MPLSTQAYDLLMQIKGAFIDQFWTKNAHIRSSYNEQLENAFDKYKLIAKKIHAEGQTIDIELAREVYELRNEIKIAHQLETPWLERTIIGIRNYLKYNNKTGPNFDDLLKKGKSVEDIFYSSFKTDGANLGLGGNNISKILDVAEKLKSASGNTIHPEDVELNYFQEVCTDLDDQCLVEHYQEVCFENHSDNNYVDIFNPFLVDSGTYS